MFNLFLVRLVSNGTGAGRLEIYHDGVWGTVCYDDEWHVEEAIVACRQLGFTGGIPMATSAFGPGTGRVWLSLVNCRLASVGNLHNLIRKTSYTNCILRINLTGRNTYFMTYHFVTLHCNGNVISKTKINAGCTDLVQSNFLMQSLTEKPQHDHFSAPQRPNVA